METLFIYAKSPFDLEQIDLSKVNTKNIPKKIGLITTIQYVEELPKVKEFLDSKGFECVIGGETLGCHTENADKIAKEIDAFLYIGSGHFHPNRMFQKYNKPIYTQNGDKLDATKYEKAHKAALTRFYNSDNVGFIITMKWGQNLYHLAENAKKRLEKHFPEKNFYLFVCETLDFSQMQNFPFIKSWINTACPRIKDDIKELNLEDVGEILKNKEKS